MSRLPENTRIKAGYVEFRKQYKGRTVNKSWPYAVETWPRVKREILDLLASIENNRYEAPEEESRLTVGEACDLFYEKHGINTPSKENFPACISRIKEFMGQKYFDTVTHLDVQRFRTWLSSQDFRQSRFTRTGAYRLSPGTINKHMACLVSVFNRIREWVELEEIKPVKLPKQHNPASLVGKIAEEEDTRTRVLSREEFDRLCAQATPRLRDVVKAAIFTLLRFSDLKRLETGTGPILRGMQGKTGKPYRIATNGVFFGKLDFTNFHRDFATASRKANIRDFQFRDLRRTGATWLFRETNDLGMVQKRLGHSSPVMTRKYLGILEDDEKRGSEVLGRILANIAGEPKRPGEVGEELGKNTGSKLEIR